MRSAVREKIWLGSVVFAPILYFAAFIAKFSRFPIDDSYVHLRIARNFALHGQPYFNLNEKVMGSAPHLWIQILALGLRIFGDQRFLPYLAFVLVTGAYACGLYLLRTRFSLIWSCLVTWLIFALFLMGPTAGLMETPLAILLYLLTIIWFLNERLAWAGVCAGLAVAVRPELSVFAAMTFLAIKGGPPRLRFLFGLVPIALLHASYALYYYGTLIPFPAISKHVVFPATVRDGILHGITVDLRSFWAERLLGSTPNLWLALTASCLLGTYAWLIVTAFKHRERWVAVMCVSAAIIHGVYIFLQRSYIWEWYVPLFTVPLAFAFARLGDWRRWPWMVASAALVVAFAMHLQIGAQDIFALVTGQEQYEEEFGQFLNFAAFAKVGRELYENTPNATAMTSEIGIFGWEFKGKIIDSGAMVSPEALKYHEPAFKRGEVMHVSALQMAELKPDYMVMLNAWSERVDWAIATDVLKGYKLGQSLPLIPEEISTKTGISELWGSNSLNVYVKAGEPAFLRDRVSKR